MRDDSIASRSDLPLDTLLNPHRAEEQERARQAGALRLEALNVRLTGTETSDEIGDMLDAIERFEQAVEAKGGDLMVDEGPHGRVREPDDPDFVLPERKPGDSPAEFCVRVAQQTARLRHPGRRGRE